MENFSEFINAIIKGFLLVMAAYSLGFIAGFIFDNITKILNYFKTKKY
jgi:hypothetical protein